ncbi:hypothetical protein ACLOJK_007077 [Asimina triloba]
MSVCHTIIYLTEGSHFDTQILKNFRVLQAAKHTMASFVKSHISPMVTSKSASLPTQYVQTSSSNASPPARGSSVTGRQASAISLMSGSGSYPSLFPGQCSPAVLFVFLDDYSDCIVAGHHGMDPGDVSSMDQPSIFSGLSRSSLPATGSSSVVMLARFGSKTEGSFRKKLQSSLEAQVRFLIKKCRTLAGNDMSHSGSRGGTNMSSSPLFTLDASRAVVLLDRSINHKVESLEISMAIVDEIINGKATSDMLLVENNCQNSSKEDIQSIKDYICRQCDSLRGRGGLAANANSGSSSGVGMVAVAAAAAAASAASGKTYSAPELPDLENWLSSSQLIFKALLAAKRFLGQNAGSGRSFKQNGHPIQIDGIGPVGADVLRGTIACLERVRGLNMKFSMIWCQRALPDAKEIYLKDLPACYPTSHHEVQLGKALCAFRSMVKGPAVQEFVKRLEDECNLIWKSGRQLCDVISLTGKPCVHQRHDNGTGDLCLQGVSKPHSSGFVFLHACACGRSRRLREDPFDFESANTTFNTFKCDQFLPTLQLPKAANKAGPVQASSWSLVRLGNARYYDASKGVLQSGFCSTQKFLFRWKIPLQKLSKVDSSSTHVTLKELSVGSPANPKVEKVADESKNMSSSQLVSSQAGFEGLENQKKPVEQNSSIGPKISFGSGLPPFFMKRPFSEVVAGSVAVDSAFPPLQHKQETAMGSEKGVKPRDARDQIEVRMSLRGNHQDPSKSHATTHKENADRIAITRKPDGDPFLQIGSNVVPVNVNGCANTKSNSSLKHAVVYVGFEHECSHGHRFLLSPNHLNELGPLYTLDEESHSNSKENSNKKVEELPNLSKNHSHEKVRMMDQSREKIITSKQHKGDKRLVSRLEEQNLSTAELEGSPHFPPLDADEFADSLLNRKLPIYMNCPHCKLSRSKERSHKFASTVSQLQRIFLVTPAFPVVLATCPVVQFEDTCLPTSVPDRERQLQFSPGHQIILPPESFLSFRLPFVYGVQLQDRSLHPLNHAEHQPELTAWIMRGTILQLVSTGSNGSIEVVAIATEQSEFPYLMSQSAYEKRLPILFAYDCQNFEESF